MKDSIIDVTNELDTVQRAILVSNCPDGILIGGKSDGQQYHRRFASKTMTANNEVYARTGEIMYCYEDKKYIVAYKFSYSIVDN